MAYNKTTWINGTTIADEDNMNNIENGIKGIDNQLNQSTFNNVDANDFKTSGFYYLGTGCSNVPSTYIKLIVNGNVDVSQIAIHVDGTNPTMFIRSFDGTNWSGWKRIDNQITLTELSNSQSKFTNIQINDVVRSGNVVTVDFRGYIDSSVSSNTEFLRLPYYPGASGTGVAWIGGNYDYTDPKWFYWTRHDKVLRGQGLSSGTWYHMHFTYITDDD